MREEEPGVRSELLCIPRVCPPCIVAAAHLRHVSAWCVQYEYEGVLNLVALAKNKGVTKFVLVSPPPHTPKSEDASRYRLRSLLLARKASV